jgi:hypothetical protein
LGALLLMLVGEHLLAYKLSYHPPTTLQPTGGPA